jgi:hypothetical protein
MVSPQSSAADAERAGDVLVVMLGAARVDELVQAGDRHRNAKLKEFHGLALMASAKDSE